MANFKINYAQTKKSLMLTNKQSNSLAAGNAGRRFESAKNQLLEDFDNHLVTKELQSGPYGENQTKSLPEGNLYGFIGFDNDPITPLRETIASETQINLKTFKTSVDGNKLTYQFNVKTPSQVSIQATAPMPEWSTGSWATKIEKAISGLEYFLFKLAGRSGGGLQIKGKLRSGKFSGIPYLSELFANFKNELTK